MIEIKAFRIRQADCPDPECGATQPDPGERDRDVPLGLVSCWNCGTEFVVVEEDR